MAYPSAGGAVAADVGEGFVVVAVRRAEGHLLNGLVHNEILRDTASNNLFHLSNTHSSVQTLQDGKGFVLAKYIIK